MEIYVDVVDRAVIISEIFVLVGVRLLDFAIARLITSCMVRRGIFFSMFSRISLHVNVRAGTALLNFLNGVERMSGRDDRAQFDGRRFTASSLGV
jgi:hypothetical protein